MSGRTKAAYRTTLHSKAWMEQKYVSECLTTHQIGDLLRCPASTVARALKRLGIPIVSQPEPSEERKCANPECPVVFVVGGRGNRKRSAIYCSRHCHMKCQTPRWSGSSAPRPKKNQGTLHNRDWLTEHYVEKKMSMGEIGILCNCSSQSVQHALQKFEIPARAGSLAMLGRKIRRGDGRDEGDDTPVARNRKAQAAAHRKLKQEMVDAYGGKCACCGEGEIAFLCLDHPDGGGMQERTEAGGSVALYRKLQKLGWPKDGRRILCANCNLATKHGRTCPHQLKKE